jgi:nucleoside-diphosphate-sugar epimerase
LGHSVSPRAVVSPLATLVESICGIFLHSRRSTENFSRQGHHLGSINQEGKVYSTTGDGKIPFVSVDDIAACAKELLTAPDAPNNDYLILGQEPCRCLPSHGWTKGRV